MNFEIVQLYGKEIRMFRKVKMNEKGINFCYNYFEDDYWENAGFSKKDCHVWSNKIGWSHFHEVVVAAYVLEELYTNGVTITSVNGDLVTSWRYVGWINYLFNEKFHIKNFDPWKLFETITSRGIGLICPYMVLMSPFFHTLINLSVHLVGNCPFPF